VRGAGRGAQAALAFLTRIPSGGHPFDANDLAWAPAFFPLVGLAIGLVLGGLHRALWSLGPFADGSLVLGASLLLTGALHEDGLADTCDALGGAVDRERVFEILKDSRIGTFGACALVVSIVGRVALLDRLGQGCLWALPLVGCAARVGPVWQMVFLRYVEHPGARSGAVVVARVPQALIATLVAASVSGAVVVYRFAGAGRIAAMAAVLLLAAALTGKYFAARVGGFTGDLLGATEQIGELAGLSVLAWGAR